ncbi:hypothetical protein NDU88_003134 [Pleurodeles waltl]|uniref:Gypsy retrotransposon integrase-like protein 1 n=1 Tax=Pleurodeles waltl TaxID=8319 RepID=A0AAV7VD61_PLEWA|nr:hypothetical protein NDU88_003134 [Pleurodeles waltl]
MSQSGDALAETAFDLEKLESYKVAQLKQFCRNVGCPIESSSKKVELQKALRAWVAAKAAEGHTDEEPEGEEELQVTHTDVVGGPAMSQGRISRASSSVSSKGLTPEELQDRQAEREYQLEQRRLALEEKKITMAHELSLKEIDHRNQSSRDGGSNSTVQPERRVHIPKDLVRDYKKEDDIYLWFKGYESALHMNLVPEAHWGAALWKHFEAEGRDTLTALGDAQSLTYPAMKEALLTRYGLTPEQYKEKFRSYKRKESQTWLECVDSFCRSLDGWVKGSKVNTYEGLYNLIAWEHLYSLCFPELRQHLIDSKLTDPRKLAQEADRWESTRVQKRYGGDHAKGGQGPSQKKGGGKGKQDEFSKGPQTDSQGKDSQPPSEKKPWFSKGKPMAGGPLRKCYSCDQVGHVRGDPKCPKSTPAPTGAPSQGLASVALGEELVSGGWEPAEMTLVSLGDSEMVQRNLVPDNTKKYRQWVTINGQRVEALRDTGASVTTVRSHLVSEEQIDPRVLHQVVAVDNSERLCRVAQVPFEWGGVSGSWKVAVSPTMPVDCLLGNDLEDSPWKEVEHRSHLEMLGLPGWVCVSTRSMAANQGSQEPLEPETVAQGTAKKRKGRRRGKPAPEVPTVREEAEPEGDAPEPTGEQVAELGEVPELSQWQQEGGPTREVFCTAQKECPTLEGLRQQAAAQAAGGAPGTHLIYWEDGLLYSEPKVPEPGSARMLVVPQGFRTFLLGLAHDVPLAGHLGQDKTYKRLVSHFYWPLMNKQSAAYCRSCQTCQASGKSGGKCKAPLQPLPVVSTPFERVGIDIVGPLDPKTALGNRFILVLVDHATRYPEAIPLRTVTAPVVGRALMGVFTRMGFPKEVVSDRGTNFISTYMKSLWKVCGVTYKFTTPYHPQSNGLVERFNRTLKGMIQGLSEPLRRKWDVLLPCLLFAYREVPQKGLGFSPFELIYGHPVRGPLSLVKEALEKAPSKPPQDVFSYMLALRNQTARFRRLAQENLEASQEDMKRWYDQNATLVEFQPGQKVWVMAPVEPRALQDKWTGPFEVVERKSEVTYLVDLQSPRNPLRVLHVNRLKPHFERTELSMLLATDDGVEEESEPLPDLLSAGEKDGSVEGVILSPSLTEEQQRDCRHVLGQFASLFSLIPGVTHLCTHDVDTGDSTPVKHKVYRVTDRVRACIKEEVSKMLALRVIEHSSSPWASPVVLVPKATAPGATPELRFCVDYRGLNAVSKTNAHPIPRADELIDRLGAAQYLSTFDLTSGYWQIALTEGAKERSAFSTPDGHFHFNVMPFGMKNAPATFQRLVNQVLAGLDEFSAAYLDDIAVFSSTWEEHLQHLWRVLEALQKAGLTIKASKCQIGQGSVVYLGHQVGSGQVAPLQPKIDTILAWEPPKTQTEVRAFLGLTGYYRRFVKGYGTIVTPLTELTSKKQPKKVIWTEACQNAFDALKAAMCTAPVLKAPDYSTEFVVQTDASEHGIGAVLSQLNEEGLDQPVAFISRRLLPRERRWSAIEREAFAVVWALKKLRPYLFGTHFRVQTDHRPLRWLMQMRGENPKLLRWSISLQGMDFTVEHRPGTEHANADGLSRFFRLSDENSHEVG